MKTTQLRRLQQLERKLSNTPLKGKERREYLNLVELWELENNQVWIG